MYTQSAFNFLAQHLNGYRKPGPSQENQDIEFDHISNESSRGRNFTQHATWNKLTSTSQIHLIAHETNHTSRRRYLVKATLNVIGPLLLVSIYAVIIILYLRRPILNDVSPWRPISPRGTFFAWLVVSIFIIDWAKSGLAGVEAALISKSRRWWSPSNAQQLLWHADRNWGTPDGWARALHHYLHQKANKTDKGPSGLWWYLCVSSLLLYAAIPLAGLSLETRGSYKLSARAIKASGANITSFDLNDMESVSNRANRIWRSGEPITGISSAILYGPEEVQNSSATYLDDVISDIYERDLRNSTVTNRSVTFFSGPVVAERVHGSIWGLKTTISCSPVNPLTGLRNMYVKSIEDWSGTPVYGTTLVSSFAAAANFTPPNPLYMFRDTGSSTTSVYFLAYDRPLPISVASEYVNASALPQKGSLDLVMWQNNDFMQDESWKNITKSRYVISSISHIEDDMEYKGYGVRCEVESSTGSANLDAAARTFSNFQMAPANLTDRAKNRGGGIQAIQAVVFSAFTSASIGNYALDTPECVNNLKRGGGTGCGAWYGANQATNGPFNYPIANPTLPVSAPNPLHPNFASITPERMTLAMYKLFGAAAVAMMSTGPTGWASTFQGLDETNDLVQGLVSWQAPLVLLAVWALSVVVPSIMTFGERRFASTVGGFEMFRLGSEWKEAQISERKRGPAPGPTHTVQSVPVSRDVSPHDIEIVSSHSWSSYNPRSHADTAYTSLAHEDNSQQVFV